METVANWGMRPVFITSTFQDMKAEQDWLGAFACLAIEDRLRRHHRHPNDDPPFPQGMINLRPAAPED